MLTTRGLGPENCLTTQENRNPKAWLVLADQPEQLETREILVDSGILLIAWSFLLNVNGSILIKCHMLCGRACLRWYGFVKLPSLKEGWGFGYPFVLNKCKRSKGYLPRKQSMHYLTVKYACAIQGCNLLMMSSWNWEIVSWWSRRLRTVTNYVSEERRKPWVIVLIENDILVKVPLDSSYGDWTPKSCFWLVFILVHLLLYWQSELHFINPGHVFF